jgi:SAM-dependent methyltransferase
MMSTAANPFSIIADPRGHWEERYRQGPRPWDTGITPPEVQEFWQERAVSPGGMALDIGCGPGTNVAYLARLGLHAVGVDLAGRALMLGRDRIIQAEPMLLRQVSFVQANVALLPLLHANAIYILDVGCLHGLPPATRYDYAKGIVANLAPGGYFHLFAFDHVPDPDPERSLRGMADGEVEALFCPKMTVMDVLRGQPDRQPCRWYLLQRQG